MDYKYIVFQGREEYIIVFPPMVSHSEVASGLTVLSAGFINEDLICYGDSTTLKVSSRVEDTQLFREQYSRLKVNLGSW